MWLSPEVEDTTLICNIKFKLFRKTYKKYSRGKHCLDQANGTAANMKKWWDFILFVSSEAIHHHFNHCVS